MIHQQIQGDRPIKGIVFLLIGILIFTIQNALIKHLIDGYSVFEIVFIRSIAAIGPMLLLVHFDSGLASLRTKRWGFHIARSSLLLMSYTFYYLAIAQIPLADVVALFYVLPFMVTILSIIFLKEQVTLKRWLMMAVAFVGVLIMVNPGQGSLNISIIFPMLSALTYAISIIMTRQFASRESASVMGLYLGVFSLIVAGLIGLLAEYGVDFSGTQADYSSLTMKWFFPHVEDLVIFGLLGLTATVGFYFITEAYCIAESSTVAPFEYSGMLPAILAGFIFWQEVPSLSIMLGVMVLIVSGIYLIRLEKKSHKVVMSENTLQ